MTKKIARNKSLTVIHASNDAYIADQATIQALTELQATEDATIATIQTPGEIVMEILNAPDEPIAAPLDDEPSFDAIIDNIPADDKLAMAIKIGAEFDKRLADLKASQPNNTTQGPKLDNYRKKLAMPSQAAVLIATNTDPAFINASKSAGASFNIYTIDKISDIAAGLSTGHMRNAVNRAITKTLFAFKREGIPFTGEMSKAAVSDKIRITDARIKKIMVQHTVSTGTVSTQHSSTMNALMTLGIVKNVGSPKFPVFETIDTPATRKLEAMFAAA